MCFMLIGLFKVITWIWNRLQSFLGILKLFPYFRVFWVFWSRLPISEFLGYSEVVFLFQSFLSILKSSSFFQSFLGFLKSSSYFRVFWIFWSCLPISDFSGYSEFVFLFQSFLGILKLSSFFRVFWVMKSSSYFWVFWVYWSRLPISEFFGYTWDLEWNICINPKPWVQLIDLETP